MVFKRVAGGNGTYFLENVSSKASRIYFPFVFITKETIPLLGLLVFSLILSLVGLIKNLAKNAETKTIKQNLLRFMQTGVTQYTIVAFIILYSYMSITGNLNIGLRHLFPIIPLIYLLIVKKICDLLRKQHIFTKQALHWGFSVLIAWIIAVPILTYPNYTSYFNETIGGSQNGYKYVTDSNTDWGQDLKRLRIFLDQNPQIDKIRCDYFGGGNPEYYLGDKYIQWWDSMRPVQAGWYAISANSLQTSIYDTTNKNASNNYIWTQQYTPVAMIGNSILIYHITTPPTTK